jgi:hypothetical protein
MVAVRATLIVFALIVLLAVPATSVTAGAGSGLSGRPPSTMSASSEGEPLLTATFPAEALPRGAVQAAFYRLVLLPGSTLPNQVAPFCGCGSERVLPGVGAEVVLAGTYMLQLDAPLVVQRTGQDVAEHIPAGTRVPLEPGDRVIYPRFASTGVFGSAGSEPAVVFGVALITAEPVGTPVPDVSAGVRADALTELLPRDWAMHVGDGPVTVTLSRVVLPVGRTLGPYEPVGADAFYLEAGSVGVTMLPPGTDTPARAPLVYRAGTAVPFLPLPDGAQLMLEATGAEPATLIMLEIAPATA